MARFMESLGKDRRLAERHLLKLQLQLQLRLRRSQRWLCMGHVVRVVSGKAANGARGVGVKFDFCVVSHTTTLKWESGPGIRGPIRP